MPDLDTAIRTKLDEPKSYLENGIEPLIDALLAALDVHKPVSADVWKKPHLKDCSVCRDIGPEVNSPVGYPCDTVEAIAKALGVSLTD